jgi:hypothetical protein
VCAHLRKRRLQGLRRCRHRMARTAIDDLVNGELMRHRPGRRQGVDGQLRAVLLRTIWRASQPSRCGSAQDVLRSVGSVHRSVRHEVPGPRDDTFWLPCPCTELSIAILGSAVGSGRFHAVVRGVRRGQSAGSVCLATVRSRSARNRAGWAR